MIYAWLLTDVVLEIHVQICVLLVGHEPVLVCKQIKRRKDNVGMVSLSLQASRPCFPSSLRPVRGPLLNGLRALPVSNAESMLSTAAAHYVSLPPTLISTILCGWPFFGVLSG